MGNSVMSRYSPAEDIESNWYDSWIKKDSCNTYKTRPVSMWAGLCISTVYDSDKDVDIAQAFSCIADVIRKGTSVESQLAFNALWHYYLDTGDDFALEIINQFRTTDEFDRQITMTEIINMWQPVKQYVSNDSEKVHLNKDKTEKSVSHWTHATDNDILEDYFKQQKSKKSTGAQEKQATKRKRSKITLK